VKLKNRDNSKLFSSNIGLDLLKYNIKTIDVTLTEYKKSKKYSRGKIYFNFIKLVSNNDIISIILRNVIPKIFNYDKLTEQNIITLFEKIGKEIVNNVILKIYNNYKLSLIKDKDSNQVNFIYNITDDLIINLELDSNIDYINFKNIIIDIIINYYTDNIKKENIKDDLHYLIGGDLMEFFSINSDLYQISLKRGINNKLHRILLPGSNITDLILKHMLYMHQKLPMIVKPND